MTYPAPILIVGPGRCGTSAVARIVHERLSVNMMPSGFWRSEPHPEFNPLGYYEDGGFANLNEQRCRNIVTLKHFRRRLIMLLERSQRAWRYAKFDDKAYWGWGIKDPRLCYQLPQYLRLVPDAVVIRCRRNIGDVVESAMKACGWSHSYAVEAITDRERRLDDALRDQPYSTVGMSVHRSDDELVALLREIISHRVASAVAVEDATR